MRDSLISSLGSEKCDIAGDGQFDSPGFSAKYCKYSIMNINTGAILDFFCSSTRDVLGRLRNGIVQRGSSKSDTKRVEHTPICYGREQQSFKDGC